MTMTTASSWKTILTGIKRQWDVSHPPQKTERALRVHVLFTLLIFAVAPAYRMYCE